MNVKDVLYDAVLYYECKGNKQNYERWKLEYEEIKKDEDFGALITAIGNVTFGMELRTKFYDAKEGTCYS